MHAFNSFLHPTRPMSVMSAFHPINQPTPIKVQGEGRDDELRRADYFNLYEQYAAFERSEEAMGKLQVQVTELSAQNDACTERVNELVSKLTKADGDIAAKDDQIAQLRGQVTAKDDQIAELRAQNDTSNDKIQDLTRRLGLLESGVALRPDSAPRKDGNEHVQKDDHEQLRDRVQQVEIGSEAPYCGISCTLAQFMRTFFVCGPRPGEDAFG